jgi:hypothetical protein
MVEADFNRAIAHGTPEQKQKAFVTLAKDEDVRPEVPTVADAGRAIVERMPAAKRVELVQETLADVSVQAEISAAPTGTRRTLTEAIWSGVTTAAPEPPVKPEPQGTTAEIALVLYELGLQVERLARHLESEAILELLAGCDDVDAIRQLATRHKLERLARAATRCANLLPAASTADVGDDDAFEATYQAVPSLRLPA